MLQKIIRVGTSAGVIIPKPSLDEVGFKVGDRVNVDIDRRERLVVIRPVEKLSENNTQIAKLTLDFISRYRKDLEALAKK